MAVRGGMAGGLYGLSLPSWPDLVLAPLAWLALIPLLTPAACRRPARWQVLSALLFGMIGSAIGGRWVLGFGLPHGVAAIFWHGLILSAPLLLLPPAVRMLGHGTALLVLPALWTVWEWGAASGQPFFWAALGASQAPLTLLVQGADVVGVWGLSFWVVGLNVALTLLLFRGGGRGKLLPVGLVGLWFALPLAYGGRVLWAETEPDPADAAALHVALVRTGVAEDRRPMPPSAYAETARAVLTGPDLVVWPESLYPHSPLRESDFQQQVGAWAVPILFEYELELPAEGDGEVPQYSAVSLLTESNRPQAFDMDGHTALPSYRKRRLVPVAEQRMLPRVVARWMWERFGIWLPNRQRGDTATTFSLDRSAAAPVRIGAIVCYEVVFPQLTADLARAGASVLFILANDAQYGATEGWQALAFARLRAIETRRPVARTTTVGPVAVIDRFGRMVSVDDGSSPTVLAARVAPATGQSIFVRHPDAVPLASGGLVVAVCAWAAARKSRASRARAPHPG